MALFGTAFTRHNCEVCHRDTPTPLLREDVLQFHLTTNRTASDRNDPSGPPTARLCARCTRAAGEGSSTSTDLPAGQARLVREAPQDHLRSPIARRPLELSGAPDIADVKIVTPPMRDGPSNVLVDALVAPKHDA